MLVQWAGSYLYGRRGRQRVACARACACAPCVARSAPVAARLGRAPSKPLANLRPPLRAVFLNGGNEAAVLLLQRFAGRYRARVSGLRCAVSCPPAPCRACLGLKACPYWIIDHEFFILISHLFRPRLAGLRPGNESHLPSNACDAALQQCWTCDKILRRFYKLLKKSPSERRRQMRIKRAAKNRPQENAARHARQSS